MRMKTLCLGLSAALAFAACGGGGDPATPDAGTDGAAGADASNQPDANTGPCDFNEAADATNNLFEESGVPESSGQSFAPGSSFTVCGNIDPAQATTDVADADFFEFSVGTAGNVRVELTGTGASALTNLAVGVYTEQGGSVGFGAFNVSHGVAAIEGLAAGTYILGVFADLPAPSAAVPYTIRVIEDTSPCPADGNAPTYTESDESGAAHRGNDMVSIAYNRTPSGQLTASTTDVAEVSGITMAPGTTYHLRGNTAMVTSDGDEYLDRDTYAIASDASTNEVTIRLTWPDGTSDMDVFLFADGDPADEFGSGTIIGTTADELFTIAVAPGTNYWLWAGTYNDTGTGGNTDLPLTYDVTICARTFTP